MKSSKKKDEIIIHIGSHKTGSTSIQKYLTYHQYDLNDVGVFCFDSQGQPRKRATGSQLVTVYEQDGEILKKINLKPLKHIKKLDTKHRVILSAEGLFWLDSPDHIEAFKSRLDNLCQQAKIIVYLRRQDLCAVSHKAQGCKTLPASLTYGHDLTALPNLSNPNVKRFFDYYSKISAWGDIFGDENLIIRVFEADKLKDSDVVSDFLNCCNIPYQPPSESKKYNITLARDKQLFLHEVRSFFPEPSQELKMLISEITRINRNENTENKERLLPSKEKAYLFYNEFRESNRLLNQRFKISDEKSIFKEDFSFYPDQENNSLDRNELLRLFSTAFQKVASKVKEEQEEIVTAKFLKEIALQVESSNRDAAKALMEKAYQLRPSSQAIQKKVLEYRGQTTRKN